MNQLERESVAEVPIVPSLVCERLESGVDVRAIREEVASQPEAWFLAPSGGGAEQDTQHIFVEGMFGEFFPELLEYCAELTRQLGGARSTIMLVRVYPRSRIYSMPAPKKDAAHSRRLLLVLSGAIRTEKGPNDPASLAPGELWDVPLEDERELINDGDDWAVCAVVRVFFATQPAAPVLLKSRPSWNCSTPETEALRSRLRSRIVERGLLDSEDTSSLVSRSGSKLAWLFDLRTVLLDQENLDAACSLFWDRFAKELPFQIAGVEAAGIPLVIGLLMKARELGLKVNGVIVRKERKTYQRGRAVEGELTDEPMVLVDDIINSGESLEKARVTLEQAGKTVDRVFTLVDFESERGARWLTEQEVVGHSLFTLSDFGKAPKKRKEKRHTRVFVPAWRDRPQTGKAHYVVPKSTPLYANGKVFFGTDAGTVRAIDADTGDLCWELKQPSPVPKGIWSSIAHHDGKLYFGAYNGNLYSVRADDGTIKWKESVADWIGASPLLLPERDLLFIGLEYGRPPAKGSVAAFRMSTGEKVWEHHLMRLQHGSCAFSPSRNLVITGSSDHEVLALNADTGERVWGMPMRRSAKYAPVVDEERGLLVCAGFDGSIYVVRLDDGRLVAEFPTDDKCYTTPLVTHGRIFCGSNDGHLYIIGLDDLTVHQKIRYGTRLFASPRLIDGGVFIATSGGVVQELDPVSLNVLGRVLVPDAVTNGIASNLDGSRIFVLTYMNELYAYDRIRAEDLRGGGVVRIRRPA